ncbi:type II toxin-antitoxin system RelE family toxin [Singulisphaera rosea]
MSAGLPFRIEFAKPAIKYLEALPNEIRQRIFTKIELLAANPHPQGSERITGVAGHFRVRIGDYRVIYEVMDTQLIIKVVKIGHRRDVYRGI